MHTWLSVSLGQDLATLRGKIALPDYSDHHKSDPERRIAVVDIAATLPGLRMCERRRAILLAQSAPPVELVALAEVLGRLMASFESVWPTLAKAHEDILAKTRQHLTLLAHFAEQLQNIQQRRERALILLDGLEGSPLMSPRDVQPEPAFRFAGYEVSDLLVPLRRITYPDVLLKPSRSRR
jgi:hypothetical protein